MVDKEPQEDRRELLEDFLHWLGGKSFVGYVEITSVTVSQYLAESEQEN